MVKSRLHIYRRARLIGIFALLWFPLTIQIFIHPPANFTSRLSNRTFMINGDSSWVNMTPVTSPSRRNHAPLTYDTESDYSLQWLR